MDNYPILKNAPITEALIDIQVTLPQETNLTTLEGIYEAVKDRFPTKQDRKIAALELKEGEFGVPSVEVIGYLLSSEDKKVLQVRLDGFTFSKLKPYENWETLKKEAEELWQIYLTIAKPVEVKRIAVRNINRIELALPFLDFREYILTIPDIAPGIPQSLSEFLMRLVIPHPESDAIAILSQRMEPYDPGKNSIALIFDIDVFQETRLAPTSTEIWGRLDALRKIRNNLFFKSITPKAKELFQ